MELAAEKQNAAGVSEPLAGEHQGEAGTSSGVNISPGSEDDGWIVPDPVTLQDGTSIQLYKDGEALSATFKAIQNAKHRICLEVYIFASDPTGRAFADLLCAKAKEGLRVFVVYDSFGSFATDLKMFAQMRRAGVRLDKFHPLRPWDLRFGWRPFNRDHRKLLLVDDDIAWMGGLNIAAEYAGSWVVKSDEACCDPWRDTSIGIKGPAAKFFLKSFANTWRYLHHGGRIRSLEMLHDVGGESDLGILASVPTMSSPLRPLLHRIFDEAKLSIELTMAYFAPDDDLINRLCRAAQRGVKVRLMLPGMCDIKALLIAARSFYAKLLENGVEIYERQGCVLHAKTMILDGKSAMVGSTNLDYRSIEYNCEISAMIRNETFARQMQNLFENDVRYAKRITLKQWRRRPMSDRFVQWMVSRARYLL